MTATLWRRVVRCTVADREFERLRIAFRISREPDAPPAGRIDIHNLAVATEDDVLERGEEITLVAGYEETAAEIFRGRLEKVTREEKRVVSRRRSGTSRITSLQVTSEAQGPELLGGFTSRGYQGEVPIRQLALDMASDFGMPITGLEAVPADATIANWVWSLSTAAGLTAILSRVGCTWHEDDGEIRINKIGSASPGGSGDFGIGIASGLLGSPTLTDEGASVVTLLNPLMRLGSRVTVDSKTVQGTWKVAALAHEGDNWLGEFQTRLSLRPIGESA